MWAFVDSNDTVNATDTANNTAKRKISLSLTDQPDPGSGPGRPSGDRPFPELPSPTNQDTPDLSTTDYLSPSAVILADVEPKKPASPTVIKRFPLIDPCLDSAAPSNGFTDRNNTKIASITATNTGPKDCLNAPSLAGHDMKSTPYDSNGSVNLKSDDFDRHARVDSLPSRPLDRTRPKNASTGSNGFTDRNNTKIASITATNTGPKDCLNAPSLAGHDMKSTPYNSNGSVNLKAILSNQMVPKFLIQCDDFDFLHSVGGPSTKQNRAGLDLSDPPDSTSSISDSASSLDVEEFYSSRSALSLYHTAQSESFTSLVDSDEVLNSYYAPKDSNECFYASGITNPSTKASLSNKRESCLNPGDAPPAKRKFLTSTPLASSVNDSQRTPNFGISTVGSASPSLLPSESTTDFSFSCSSPTASDESSTAPALVPAVPLLHPPQATIATANTRIQMGDEAIEARLTAEPSPSNSSPFACSHGSMTSSGVCRCRHLAGLSDLETEIGLIPITDSTCSSNELENRTPIGLRCSHGSLNPSQGPYSCSKLEGLTELIEEIVRIPLDMIPNEQIRASKDVIRSSSSSSSRKRPAADDHPEAPGNKKPSVDVFGDKSDILMSTMRKAKKNTPDNASTTTATGSTSGESEKPEVSSRKRPSASNEEDGPPSKRRFFTSTPRTSSKNELADSPNFGISRIGSISPSPLPSDSTTDDFSVNSSTTTSFDEAPAAYSELVLFAPVNMDQSVRQSAPPPLGLPLPPSPASVRSPVPVAAAAANRLSPPPLALGLDSPLLPPPRPAPRGPVAVVAAPMPVAIVPAPVPMAFVPAPVVAAPRPQAPVPAANRRLQAKIQFELDSLEFFFERMSSGRYQRVNESLDYVLSLRRNRSTLRRLQKELLALNGGSTRKTFRQIQASFEKLASKLEDLDSEFGRTAPLDLN